MQSVTLPSACLVCNLYAFVQSIDSENYSQYHIETIAEIEQKSEN